jgi:hypothetical protein
VFSKRVFIEGCKGVDGKAGDVTSAYGYAFALATRRAKRAKIEETAEADGSDDDERIITKRGEALWHKDYMETYRHLREHGNSAFIFLLELTLAALIYCITVPDKTADKQLSTIGLLFAVWTAPAVLAHFIGQYLERRFSHYDRRLQPSPPSPTQISDTTKISS